MNKDTLFKIFTTLCGAYFVLIGVFTLLNVIRTLFFMHAPNFWANFSLQVWFISYAILDLILGYVLLTRQKIALIFSALSLVAVTMLSYGRCIGFLGGRGSTDFNVVPSAVFLVVFIVLYFNRATLSGRYRRFFLLSTYAFFLLISFLYSAIFHIGVK